MNAQKVRRQRRQLDELAQKVGREAERAAASVPPALRPDKRNAREAARKREERIGRTMREGQQALQAYNERESKQYFLSLVDPFSVKGARIPSRIPVASAAFSVGGTVAVPVKAATDIYGRAGDAMFLLNGGILNCYNVLGVPIVHGDVHKYYDSLAATDKYWPVVGTNGIELMGTTETAYGVLAWEPSPQYASVKGAFAAYRIVSMGARITYTGPALAATGTVTVALWPGAFNWPCCFGNVASPTAPMNKLTANVPMSPDTVRLLVDAQTFATNELVGKSIVKTWRPAGDECDAWRPMSYATPYWQQANAANAGEFSPVPCDTDPSYFKAMVDSLIVANSLTAGTFNKFYPPNSATMSPATPGIIVFANNCDVTDGSFEVTWVVNYEGISEEKSLQFPGSSVGHAVSANGAIKARIAAQHVPTVSSGESGHSFITKAGSALTQAWNTAQGVYNAVRPYAGKIGNFAENALGIDNAGMFGEVLTADGLEGLAALALL